MTDGDVRQEQLEAAERQQRMMAVWTEADVESARATATPQRFYHDLMERSPVVEFEGGFQLLKMEDVLFVNRHRDTRQASKYLGSSRPAIPLGLDGPEHRKYRKLLDPVFSPKRVEPLAPQVRQLAADMIEGFVDKGACDAYHDWAEPLPSTIFLTMLGLPTDELDDFLRFKNLTLGNAELGHLTAEEQAARRMEAVEWIHGYFNAALDERERSGEPGDDLIGWLITTEVESDRLSREEVLDILGLLVIAGLDTVAASLACFLSYFARNPEHRERVVSDPSLWPSAIEELMRFESPVTDGFRVATADMELPSGTRIPEGSSMGVSWYAANLDPDAFDDPLTVDLERTPNRHIGFASGFHRCLGSHLARMEMLVAMEAWHERIPDYAIAPGAELIYSGNPRAPHTLPLVW
jgi:cytochrome P450